MKQLLPKLFGWVGCEYVISTKVLVQADDVIEVQKDYWSQGTLLLPTMSGTPLRIDLTVIESHDEPSVRSESRVQPWAVTGAMAMHQVDRNTLVSGQRVQ